MAATATDQQRRNQRDLVRSFPVANIDQGIEPVVTVDNTAWDATTNWAVAIRDVYGVPVAAGWLNGRARLGQPTDGQGGVFGTANAVPVMTRVLQTPVQGANDSATPSQIYGPNGGTTGGGSTGGGSTGGGSTGGAPQTGGYTPAEQAIIDRYTGGVAGGGSGGMTGGGMTGGGGTYDASKAPGGGGGSGMGAGELEGLGKFDMGTTAGAVVAEMAGILPDMASNPVVLQILQWLAGEGFSVLRRLTDAIGLTNTREDVPFCLSMLEELQKNQPEVYAALTRAVCNAPPIGLTKQGEWIWYAIRMARNPNALEAINGSTCAAMACRRR